MGKKNLLLALGLLGGMILTGCAPEEGASTSNPPAGDTSSSEPTLDPGSSESTGVSGESSTSESSETPVNRTVDQAFIDLFKGGIDFTGVYTEMTAGTGIPSSISYITGFIGETTYSFRDSLQNTVYAELYLSKADDGNTVSSYIAPDNKVYSAKITDEDDNLVPYDQWFYNPFADLTIEEAAEEIVIEGNEAAALASPLAYYMLYGPTVTLSRIGDTLRVEIEDAFTYGSRNYDREIVLNVEVSELDDLEPLAPYPTEEYHANIKAALQEWTLALAGPSDPTGFVYEKTRHAVGIEGIEDVTVRSTITYDAILYENDGGITNTLDNGVALFDDGNYYEYEISETGEVIVGDYYGSSMWIPFPSMMAAEVFVETDTPNVYALRNPSHATEAVRCFLESEDEILWTNYMGAWDVEITLKDTDTIDSFAYTTYMYSVDGDVYEERVTVKVLEFDEATIDYDFVLPKVAMPAEMIDTWTGTEQYSGTDYELVINEDGTGTLNGEAIAISPLTEDAWGDLSGTLTAGGVTYDFEYLPAYSYYPKEIVLSIEDEEGNYTFYVQLYEKVEIVGVPEGAAGTWAGTQEDGRSFTLVIGEDGSITLNGTAATDIGEWEQGLTGQGLVFTVDGVEYIIRYMGTSVRLMTEDMSVYVDLTPYVEEETPVLEGEIVGTWTGTDTDGVNHTLVIGSDGYATLDGVRSDDIIEYNTKIFGAYGEMYFGGVCYDYTLRSGNLEVYTSTSNPFDCTFTKAAEPETPSVTFPDNYVGTWVTLETASTQYTLVIGADGSITLNGIEGTNNGWDAEYEAYAVTFGGSETWSGVTVYIGYEASYGEAGAIMGYTADYRTLSFIVYPQA